ncbi:hypothetical protein D3C72_1652670 [compost metagenome]
MSIRKSAGLISISTLSSISGETNTAENEVWRRLPESNGLLRTRRCTPISVRNQPNAYSPLMCTVAPLIPATSPADSSMMVASKPRLSAQRRYMRSRMLAQSWASVPPEPAWMSR